MSLTVCPECQGELSTAARACPHCGKPGEPSPGLVWACRAFLLALLALVWLNRWGYGGLLPLVTLVVLLSLWFSRRRPRVAIYTAGAFVALWLLALIAS